MDLSLKKSDGFICPKCNQLVDNLYLKKVLDSNIFICKKCLNNFYLDLFKDSIERNFNNYGFEKQSAEHYIKNIENKLKINE